MELAQLQLQPFFVVAILQLYTPQAPTPRRRTLCCTKLRLAGRKFMRKTIGFVSRDRDRDRLTSAPASLDSEPQARATVGSRVVLVVARGSRGRQRRTGRWEGAYQRTHDPEGEEHQPPRRLGRAYLAGFLLPVFFPDPLLLLELRIK